MNAREIEAAIEVLVEEMRDLTLAAGVPAPVIRRIFEVPHDLTVGDLEDRLRFLEGLKAAEYRDLVEIWRRLTPEVWKMYSDFGVTKLREQVILDRAQRSLRRAWRKKYGKAEQGVDQGGSGLGSVRPEAEIADVYRGGPE